MTFCKSRRNSVWGSGAALVAATLALVGAVGAAPGGGPQATAEGYRIVVERVQQSESLTLDFAPGEGREVSPFVRPNSPGRRSGRHSLQVAVAIHAPQPELLGHVERLEAEALAAPGVPLKFSVYPTDDAGRDAKRLQLVAPDVPLQLTRLRGIRGELLVYPRARMVRLDLPLKGPLPVSREVDGLRATVTQSKVTGELLSAGVQIQWPAGASVTYPNSEAPGGVQLVTASGQLITPSGTSAAFVPAGALSRQFGVSFSGVKEAPAAIRVDALLRSGTMRRIPFTLPDLELPDQIRTSPDPGDSSDDPRPLGPGHPLHAAGGGILTASVVSSAGKLPAGTLLLGLSRVDEGPGAGWSWIELAPDMAGKVELRSLAPGRYRARLLWTAESGAGESLAQPAGGAGPVQEIEITAGRSTATAPLKLEQSR